jgi:hypothetical protein
VALPLQLPQCLQTAAALSAASGIEEPEPFTELIGQCGSIQIARAIKQLANLLEGFGPAQGSLDLILSFHAANIHGREYFVQQHLWGRGRGSFTP